MSPNAPTNAMLTALSGVRAFIIFRKSDKCPVDTEGQPTDSQNREGWMLPDQAQAWAAILGDGYGVGLVLHPELKIFCVDIDGGVVDGQWSPLAQDLFARFAGAAVEVSMSQTGAHVFGRYTGDFPAHACKNTALKIECYHQLRYIALTGTGLVGDVSHDCTALLPQFIAEYFSPTSDDSGVNGEWTEGPHPDWSGPTDDSELVAKMLTWKSMAAAMGTTASFAQLWTTDVDALAKVYPPSQNDSGSYDESSADLGLANHLAFGTGNDCDRMLRLMLQSGLVRDKWTDRDGYYLQRTILKACAKTKTFYSSRPETAVKAPPPPTSFADADPYLTRVDRTDQGNANLLILLAGGNLRYVAETKQWLRWDSKRWQLDEHEVFVTTFALEVARHYLNESKRLYVLAKEPGHGDAQVAADDAVKWANKSRNKAAIDSMITLARKVPGVPISVLELDRKPHLLGVENGVVDLRSGELRENEAREDYVTKRCPVRYDPTAAAPRWLSFITEITGLPIPALRDASGAVLLDTVGRFTPRPALERYIHTALGYSITGEVREHKFFLGIGPGSNGKNVALDVVQAVLGPYAKGVPSEMFLATKRSPDAERPTPLAASLAGVRLVVSSETKDGQHLDIGVIKSHTGDGKMNARRMRQDGGEFDITHKPWLLTNELPGIDRVDPAIKGRLHYIPFDRRWNRPGETDRNPALPDGDKELKAHLLGVEREGILAALVRGAVVYYAHGLNPPAEVIDQTKQSFAQQDHLGRWLLTMQQCAAKQGMSASELFTLFGVWVAKDGCEFRPATQAAFGRALGTRGIDKYEGESNNKWGLRTLQAVAPPPKA